MRLPSLVDRRTRFNYMLIARNERLLAIENNKPPRRRDRGQKEKMQSHAADFFNARLSVGARVRRFIDDRVDKSTTVDEQCTNENVRRHEARTHTRRARERCLIPRVGKM